MHATDRPEMGGKERSAVLVMAAAGQANETRQHVTATTSAGHIGTCILRIRAIERPAEAEIFTDLQGESGKIPKPCFVLKLVKKTPLTKEEI